MTTDKRSEVIRACVREALEAVGFARVREGEFFGTRQTPKSMAKAA